MTTPSGFFFARVVNRRDDELKAGRVQIRVLGIHDDVVGIPDSDLPWAYPVQSMTSAGFERVGTAPVGVLEGSTVVGFWADPDRTIPMVIGTVARSDTTGDGSDNDVPRNARGTDEAERIVEKDTADEDEPPSAYAARYPYCKATRTERGHILEVDDTPGAERIRVYHRSGSYVEVGPDGRWVVKGVGDRYTVVAGSDRLKVSGKMTVVVDGDATVTVRGDASVSAGGNLTARADGDASVSAGGDLSIDASGDVGIRAGGDVGIEASGSINLRGSRVTSSPCIDC